MCEACRPRAASGRTAILCDAIRAISTEPLIARWGVLTSASMRVVEDRLRILLRP
jgi:mRNA-degrading endonuclease toxin of MazEF toxin-antitoxin module